MKLKTLITSAILCTGLWYVSASGYMLSKAWLSQYLIKDAWQQTLEDKQQHKPWSWADTYPIATLNFPRLDKNNYILEGSSGRNLAFSVAHLSKSGMPNDNRTIIISGHNDSHFSYLEDVTIGDKVLITTAEKTSGYIVHNIEIIDSKKQNLKIINKDELVLTTCYPFNTLSVGGDLRYVVYANPV